MPKEILAIFVANLSYRFFFVRKKERIRFIIFDYNFTDIPNGILEIRMIKKHCMGKKTRIRTTLSKGVVVPSLIFIVGICLLSAIYPKLTESLLNSVKDFIFVNLNYVY